MSTPCLSTQGSSSVSNNAATSVLYKSIHYEYVFQLSYTQKYRRRNFQRDIGWAILRNIFPDWVRDPSNSSPPRDQVRISRVGSEITGLYEHRRTRTGELEPRQREIFEILPLTHPMDDFAAISVPPLIVGHTYILVPVTNKAGDQHEAREGTAPATWYYEHRSRHFDLCIGSSKQPARTQLSRHAGLDT